ncbi:hypothetical protein [Vibrio mediterranei]|uniref:hypothetical protein n=1 Tax=Vibrio mediterranei TaxID=689 RepID=UPI0040678AE2
MGFKAFDHLEVIRQGEIVENKRLGEVLKHAKSEQERMDREGKRKRRDDSPKRQEQQRQVRMNLAVLSSMKEDMVT